MSDHEDGFVAVLATDPARSSDFFDELRELVRNTSGGVLVCLRQPALWTGGPVVGIHLRRPEGRPGSPAIGPGLWLGPLCAPEDQCALCDWLRDGGPVAGPPPVALRRRILPGPSRPMVASQNTN
jgi:hypothetical protein